MPALPDYPNVIRVRWLFTVGDDTDIGTSLHFTYTGPTFDDATAAAVASSIFTADVSDMTAILAGGNYATGVQVTDLTSPTAGFGEHLGSTAGTRAGVVLPASAAVLMNMAIARRYRGGKPRAYWPFGSEDDLATAQTWSSGSITSFETTITNLINHVIAAVTGPRAIVALCSVSYYEGFTTVLNPVTGRTRDVPKVRTAAIAPDVALSYAVNPIVGSQRKRLKRGS